MVMKNTTLNKQEGFIRAFCQVYSCSKAIEEFLSDRFQATPQSGIYQSKTDSTIQLVVDEDSQSIHYPGILKPYNAFHLVRIYQYGHLDRKVEANTPLGQLPSFQAMIKCCRNDAAVRTAFVKLQSQKTSSTYDDWEAALSINSKTNSIESTGKNLKLILLNDPKLSQVRYNRFTKKDETECPEFSNERGNLIDDESIGKMALYIEETYGLYIPQIRILEMLKTTATERSFHPIKDFILSEVWDGVERVDTLIIRYLKGEDSMLTRAQTRKWMIAAVARIFEPGCKFDHVLTLAGPEGAGKSTFFKILANGEWFSDSFSFKHDDKAKVEEITGHWIVELSELSGMDSKQDPQLIKAFLSREKDEIRPAYARKCETIPRSNVFAGSTNQSNFLQNCNGNRRWWIIPIQGDGGPENWQEALKREVPQLWAEAYHYYQSGEPIFLPKELEMEARRIQEQFTENQADELLDDIEAFLERPVPAAYDHWSISARLQWQLWKTGRIDWLRDEYRQAGTHMLTMVSARMIKEELPNELIRTSHRYRSNYINALMAKFPNWKRSEQEKVSGLPLFYCGADGRAKYPWLRCPTPPKVEEPKTAPSTLLSPPFMESLNQEGKEE